MLIELNRRFFHQIDRAALVNIIRSEPVFIDLGVCVFFDLLSLSKELKRNDLTRIINNRLKTFFLFLCRAKPK